MTKKLTRAEEQIMQAIWKIETGFAKDILEALDEPKPAYNTVLTVVRVLVDKGFVKFKTYGKSNEYYATISKSDYSKAQLSSIQAKYFNNSTKELLSFFLKENAVDLKELNAIIKDLNEHFDQND
ncbi:MAG: BlaI/MecI/CopY family transcriptional regulator [Putridiphycobacter sp.]|nr:BlaI/MecI/CopY family transcriptional regulator [Putridiphycobacter sp.]